MVNLYIKLTREAALALHGLADMEHRDPKQQASFLIEMELERRGLLEKNIQGNTEKREAGVGSD